MKTAASTSGIGFANLLTLLFIALKVTGYISWSWVWVLAPTWIPVVLGFTLLGLAVVVFALLRE